MSASEGEAVGAHARQQLKTSIPAKIVGHHLSRRHKTPSSRRRWFPPGPIGARRDAGTPPRSFLSWCWSWPSRRNPRFCRRFRRWTPDRRYLPRQTGRGPSLRKHWQLHLFFSFFFCFYVESSGLVLPSNVLFHMRDVISVPFFLLYPFLVASYRAMAYSSTASWNPSTNMLTCNQRFGTLSVLWMTTGAGGSLLVTC